jgi:chemotaxis methyl-accepting protein methylase
LISQDRQRDWKILDVGCGRGPEPYELGMRIVKNGGENFSIDAFDVSDKAIEEAKKGRFVHYCDIRSSDGEFLKKMEKVGVLHIIGETKSKIGLTDSITYQADSRVASRLAFSTHDIIDGPFLPNNKAEYDLALCNNVLQHFPAWTRELMLLHILENMKDGALLVLEHNELLYGLGMTQERVAWLKPYYDWKETLDRFGLQKEKIEPECLLLPMTVYRYDPTKNPYKGKHYAIRDKALVEIK